MHEHDPLVNWVRASDRQPGFLTAALEAAWEALNRHKLRTLGYVLADGMQDEARIHIDYWVACSRPRPTDSSSVREAAA